ncbi:MAG: acyl-CoA dehydrogenase domain protein [Frankiales bacterium]|nr:acyl-CoA dehydrogenase domain protein [Frankiales bacterium]
MSIDTTLTEEQDALADLVRTWLRRDDPVAALRPRLDADGAQLDRTALAAAADSGLLGLLRPDEGGSLLDLALVVEEAGRALSPLPLAELALAARLLDLLGSPLADAVAAGEQVWLPVVPPLEGLAWSSAAGRLVGSTAVLPALPEADGLLVLLPEGAALVPLGTDGVRPVRRSLLDLSRPWGSADLDLVPGVTACDPDLLLATQDALALLRTVDALGAAARLLEMTVQYAGEREQFGRAIGSFQAVKHTCADMALLVEASRELLHLAAASLDVVSPSERRRLVSAAVAYAGPATSRTASLALQVHGGMGFTWEHDLHLLLRRVKTDELLDGSTRHHRRVLVPA